MTNPGGETLWFLIATSLLMLVLVGVALFYGGMVRRKNVLNTIGMPFSALAVASLVWLCVGDRILYGGDETGSLRAVHHALMASLSLGLIAGGIVERVRFSFFLAFGALWILLVYGPVASWLWAGGWLTKLGSLDYAGGAVVHLSAGVTALVAAIVLGTRRGYGRNEMLPSHLPFSFLGVGLMWAGWFGMTVGPGPVSMTIVTTAFVAIQLSAASAALTWMVAEWLQREKPTALGMGSGLVAGLVAISPAAGYVSPVSAVVIGTGAGGLCYMAVNYVKLILGYDDSLDVFGMHGVGGAWGMVATGLFASTEANPDGSDGLFFGYPYQFFAQLVSTVVVAAFAGGMSFLSLKGLRLVLSPRVDEQAEIFGLDLAQHGEKGFVAHGHYS
ncbi:ammonium transporter [Nitrospira sp.]|nr:ammonium transporter [Nitrospira sp.]